MIFTCVLDSSLYSFNDVYNVPRAPVELHFNRAGIVLPLGRVVEYTVELLRRTLLISRRWVSMFGEHTEVNFPIDHRPIMDCTLSNHLQLCV